MRWMRTPEQRRGSSIGSRRDHQLVSHLLAGTPSKETQPVEAKLVATRIIKIKTSDGRIFKVQRPVAMEMKLIQMFISDNDDDNIVIPLADIHSFIFQKCLTYCEKNVVQVAAGNAPRPHDVFWHVASFVGEIAFPDIIDLTKAANYLEIDGLFDRCCYRISQLVRGWNPLQLYQKLNLRDPQQPPPQYGHRFRRLVCKTNESALKCRDLVGGLLKKNYNGEVLEPRVLENIVELRLPVGYVSRKVFEEVQRFVILGVIYQGGPYQDFSRFDVIYQGVLFILTTSFAHFLIASLDIRIGWTRLICFATSQLIEIC